MVVYSRKGKSSRQTKEGGWKMPQGKNVTRKLGRKNQQQEDKGVGTFGGAEKV